RIKFISNLSSSARWRKTEGVLLRWLCCLFVFMSCNSEDHNNRLILTHNDSLEIHSRDLRAFQTIQQAKHLVGQGDMILRTGNDFTSESLRRLSTKDKTYSHCGIASIE